MKKRILAIILSFCLLATIAFSATAQDYDPGVDDKFEGITTTVATPSEPINPSEPIIPEKVAIGKCLIKLEQTVYEYNGKKRTPVITVSKDSTTFEKDVDFTVVYKDNINAGTAKAILTANPSSEKLSGSITKYFRIDKKDISTVKSKKIVPTEYVYTGTKHKPELKFTFDGIKLEKSKDFTLSYTNNKYTGLGTVTATGVGNYKGTYSKNFYIRPQKVNKVKISKVKDTTFKMTWEAVSGKVSGYRLYRYNAEKKTYDYAVSTKNTYFDVSGRTPATVYKYIVRAYKQVGNRVILGEESEVKSVVMRPKKVVIKPSAYSGNTFTFKWEKAKGNGYELIYSPDRSFKTKTIRKTINSSKTTSLKVKLNKNKQYYYRVRAFKKVGDKVYYGAFSTITATKFSNVYSSYSTTFYSPAGRTENIKVACRYIDGTVLRPGEVFSFNKVVGQRTPQRGFKLATVYRGEETAEGYGGGVCQVSTTIFNAALYGNLQIVERYQHSMTVHYVPYGRDAAISWGSADFKFKNTTNSDMKISAKVYNNSKIEIKLLTNTKAKHPKVSLNVSSSYYSKDKSRYVLTRSANGKVNYSTSSIY